MAKAPENSISKKLKRWAGVALEKKNVEAKRDQKLAPLRTKFEEQCAPIIEAANEKLATLESELATLTAEIESELKAGAKPDGTIAIPQVVIKEATARVKPTPVRNIPPQKFFEAIPASERTGGFWSCIKVLLGESTKLIGDKRVEQLAEKTYSYKVEISLS